MILTADLQDAFFHPGGRLLKTINNYVIQTSLLIQKLIKYKNINQYAPYKLKETVPKYQKSIKSGN